MKLVKTSCVRIPGTKSSLFFQQLLSSSVMCLDGMDVDDLKDGDTPPVDAQLAPAIPSEPSTPLVIEQSPVTVQPTYTSRYQSDFKHVQCLGKGGFGVVFHAQNLLDECEYAIKRITLPNRYVWYYNILTETKLMKNYN